jgi:hypothetical protein
MRVRSGPWDIRARLGVILSALLVLAGCANLPDSSAPQALGTLDKEPTSAGPPTPVAGREPDSLLRDFLQATADPTNHHQTARQYLTPEAAASWDDTAGTVIIEKQPDTLRESGTTDTATYHVRAHKLGDLDANGSFRAATTSVEYRFDMTKVGGEWRIDELPAGVVIEDAAFTKSYRRYPLFFPNNAGTAVVPDLRWIALRKDQLAPRLLSMLQDGPQQTLAPAVRDMLSGTVAVHGPITRPNGDPEGVGVAPGGVQIDFAGASALDQHSRELLAGQVVLTLYYAEIFGPYFLTGDGKPLDDRFAASGWSQNDVSYLNPSVVHNKIGLHAVRDGSLVRVDPGKPEVVPTPGWFGSAHNLQSVALSQDGQLVAAIADSGHPAPDPSRTLIIGTYDGNALFSLAQGTSFTRPSWTADGSAAWTVVDGDHVIRAVHDHATGNVSPQDVDISALMSVPVTVSDPAPRLPITELRISRSGARAALIAGGKVFVATVAPQPDGQYALTSPLPVAATLSTSAVSLDWVTEDSIVVVREGNVDPVERVDIDGFQPNPETSQNLTSPLRVVSASPDGQYIADARAVMQLQAAEPNSERFWREVPGLGPTATPVLPG